MRFKRILSFLASAAMTISALCGAMSITASAAKIATGDLSWEIMNGTLTITVTSQEPGAKAAMLDYAKGTSTPWYTQLSGVKKIVVGEGVTNIGNNAFYYATAATEIVLPSTITSIGTSAFFYCNSLIDLNFTDASGEDTETPPQIKTIGDSAFNRCAKLENVPASFLQYTTSIGVSAFASSPKMFPEGTITANNLTSIGTSAFNGCTSLTGISMTNRSLTTIPENAFESTGITTVKLPTSGLTTIAYRAFANSKLESISLPASLQSVGQEAFSGCSELSSLTLPSSNGVTFGSNVFQGCTSLSTISIPSSYTEVPSMLFSGCTGLTTVKFQGSNVKQISSSAFSGCTSLTEFDVPESVTIIDGGAFQGCSSLQTISLKHGITLINSDAFSGCSVLEEISLPSTVATLGKNVFKNCAAIKTITIPGSVTAIPDGAFSGCKNLASVDMPNSVESIGNDAFKDCTSLKTISLPTNLKTVTGMAFAGCTSLTEIKVPEGCTAFSNPTNSRYAGILLNADQTELIAYPGGITSTSLTVTSIASTITKIGDYAFYGNPKLTSVTLTSIKEIGNYAFNGSVVTSLTVPDSVVTIGDYAFDGASKLATLTLSSANSLENIGKYAFRNTIIKALTLPAPASNNTDNNKLKTIGESAFYGCGSLATVTFQSNSVLESIGNSAFYNCSVLQSVSIPDTVNSLGTNVFYGCAKMTSAMIGKGITVVPVGTFRNCNELKSVTIPSTVTEIGNYAFATCSNLIDVEIPNSVTTLGTYVFQNCNSLKKAVIGNKITTIPDNIFSGCTNVDLEIYLLGTISKINTGNSFGNNASTYVKGTIYVYDDTSYATLLTANPVKTSGYATLKYAANFTELISLIADAKEFLAINYTDASYSVLASALTLSEITIADYSVTQGRVDAAVASLRSAINGLVLADNTELLNKLAEAVEHAKSLVRTDYRTKEYTQLRAAYKAGEEVTGDELNSELLPLIDAIEKAEQNLVVNYAYSDPVLTVQSGKEYSDLFAYTYPAMEGTTTEAEAGATQARITFDVASHVSWGQYTTFHFKSYIQGVDESGNYIEFNDEKQDKTDDNGAGVYESKPTGALGETGLKITFDLVNPLRVGDVYHIYTYTRDYGDEKYRPYDFLVFYIREVELLDADGNVLLSTKDVNVPNEDLLAAVEEAKLANTANATEDSVQVLNDAVAAANAILEQEKPLPSAMAAAAEAIRDAIANLKQADKPSVDKTELNNEIKSADEMDTSAYTDESVAELKKAIDSAKTVAANENATKEDVDAAVKAIKDAVAALAKKPGSSDSSNNPSGSNNPSVTTPTAAPTTAAPAKRSAQQVAKDKAAAQAKVSQAKITKLTVKSKAKKKINVTWKKVKKAVGYQVQVSTKSNFKKKIFNKFTTKKKLTITNKIKSKKTYYVRVRAYATYKDVNNVTKKVYSKWNKKLRKVTVK